MENKMIEKLESKGFTRWTKGNMDRLYISGDKLSDEVTNSREWKKFENKVFIDLTDDTLHVQRGSGRWEKTEGDIVYDAVKAMINEAAAELEVEEKAETEKAQAEEATEVMVEVEQEYLDTVARPNMMTPYKSNIGVLKGIREDLLKVEMTKIDRTSGEEMTSVINVLRDRAKILNGDPIRVSFEGGQARNGEYAVDYMIAKVGDVELYAEQPAEDGEEEPWTEDLEREIKRQAREAGIRVELLEFA